MNSYTLETEIQPIRRVKERQVQDALDKVQLWKRIIAEGFHEPDGTICKVTLNRAAGIIGIPKKTLEDYNQLFRKVELITDVRLFRNEKMGVLREFLRKNSKKIKKMLKDQQLVEKVTHSTKISKNKKKQQKNTLSPEQSIEQDQTGLCGYNLKRHTSMYFQNSETPKIDNIEFEYKEEDFENFDYESYQSPLGLPTLNQLNKYDSDFM